MAVVQFSLEQSHLGQYKIVMKLTAALGLDISPNGVRRVWLRNNMNITALRIERSQSLNESE
jgi:hypothetical protein